MIRVAGPLPLFCALLFPVTASAEEIRDYYAEPGLNPFKDAINQHFNEHVDPFSGTLQLKYTDLTIPGNGGMDIHVSRVYTSLQTNQYPTLGLNGLGWTMHFGRIVTSRHHADKLCSQGSHSLTTIENPSLELPDGGRELLVLNHITNDNSLITRSNWRAQCLGTAPGLLVTSPDGTRYTMNQPDSFQGEPSWLTTRIEDLEGNWIRIDYRVNAVGVSYIHEVYRSEEGTSSPVVTYEYESEATADIKLAAIAANGQRVEYRYEAIPGFLFPFYEQLVEVERPDGRSWHYAYNPKLDDPDPNDGILEDGLASFSLVHVGYPHGATIAYTYQFVQFDPGSMQRTTAIRTKVVGGPGVTGGQWTYTFAPHSSPFPDSAGGQLRHDVTTVTGPDDVQKFYHFGKDFRPIAGGFVFIGPSFTGLLAMKDVYSLSNQLLQRTAYTWQRRLISNEDFWHGAGYRGWWRDSGTYAPVLAGEFSDRDSRAASPGFLHFVQYFDHDAFGNPGRIFQSSNLIDSPATQRLLTYFIDPEKWIVAAVEDEVLQEQVGGMRTIGAIDRTLDENGKLLRQVELGVETKYTYTTEGDLASVEDARGKVRRYSSYKRGIARREELPESVTIEREVNDTGTVRSATDGRGHTTSFQYDDLNRLTSIDFPIKADVTVSYESGGDGHRRTLTRGSYRQTEQMNDFGQVRRVERTDTATGETIYRTASFDASGRETFSSYPSSTIGVTTTYDALGRVRRTQHPDSTGVNYTYDDSTATVTNERNFTTSYVYLIRGIDFGQQAPAFIAAPENVGTIIRYDSFDSTALVFQGERLSGGSVRGYGKTYEYDARQFLVRTVEPEVGTTLYTHDEVGNVLTETVNDAEPITFVHDDLGRRVRTDFADDTPDLVTAFDNNDNVVQVTKGRAQWAYTYDENDNLLSETLTITDPLLGSRTYAIGHTYSDLDVVEQMTYPSGLVVDYAPDAFGRATKVGTFASSVTYHPSGHLAGYQLANGVVTTVALNQRLLTQRIQASALVNLRYEYDAAGNVTAIGDDIDPSRSASMTDPGSYDGLDRLRNARGPWGTASFSYDHLGNKLGWSVNTTDTFRARLDAQFRLNQVSNLQFFVVQTERSRIRMGFDARGNVASKSVYTFGAFGRVSWIDDTKFVYGADSNLARARVAKRFAAQTTLVADMEYAYDGNGQRVAEKKRRTYEIRHSVHGRSGQLLFEDSIADCTRTDYIRLGALTLARSDDQRADPDLDGDGDQIDDCMELQLGLDPANPADANLDADGDGLSNLEELLAGTSILVADTDGDGLSDGQELNQHHTDPLLPDSDGDGIGDGAEAADPRLDPIVADADHDGVNDRWELQLGTDPRNPADGRVDSDSDGFSNRQESMLGFDPGSDSNTPTRGLGTWTFETFGDIGSSPVIGADGTVYAAARTDHIFAINPDGTERWRYTVPGATLSAPTVAPSGAVYVVGDGAYFDGIHAINPDGSVRWTHASAHDISGSAVLGPRGRVYYAGYSSRLGPTGEVEHDGRWAALDDTGRLVASGSFDDGAFLAPAVAMNGDVYVVDQAGKLLAFDERGSLRWTFVMAGSSAESPVVASNERIYVADQFGITYAVSPEGALLWTRGSPDGQSRSTITIGGDGTLYIGAFGSTLYALDPADGSTLWQAPTFGTSYTPAVAADGTIYVTTFGGSVSAFSPSGERLWMHETDTSVSAPAVVDRDGTLYFGSRTGQLFAVADNGGGLADTAWPMCRHDAAGTSFTCFDNDLYSATIDTDGDGIDDCTEIANGLDPSNPGDATVDTDGDGLSNAQEHAIGTDVSLADTDGDGLSDGDEVMTYFSDPTEVDTDEDGIEDGQEVLYGFDPLDSADALLDSDGDGFSNRAEVWAGTDPTQDASRPEEGRVISTQVATNLRPQSPAIAADGTIYQIAPGGRGVEALNPNFTLKWRWSAPDFIDPPVLGPDGTIYAVTRESRQLFALFPSGRERWTRAGEPGRAGFSSPVIGPEGTLFLVENDQAGHHIVALDEHGRLKWDVATVYNEGGVPSLAVDRDGNVVAYARQRGASLYRKQDGARVWFNTGSGDSFTIGPQQPVIDADGTIYVNNAHGLRAVRPSSGAVLWGYNGASGTPIITADGLILQQCNSTLCAITRQGQLAWTTSNRRIEGSPTVGANGTIYAATNEGLRAFNGQGVELWFTPMPISSFLQPVLLDDGTIYMASNSHSALVASNSGGLADTPWPIRNRDYKNSRSAVSFEDIEPGPEPMVVIDEPRPGTSLTLDVGQPVRLSAFAIDAADGPLSSGIVWASSIDGPLGSGPSLLTSLQTPGNHVISASATDSDGQTGLASVTINVGYVAPTITIHKPDGGEMDRGEEVLFAAQASDPVDGDISDSIRWSSSLDGELGTGRELAVADLQLGSHIITAAVTDSSGTTSTATIAISVLIIPPDVVISTPSDQDGFESSTLVEFSGSAYDIVGGDLGETMEWNSDLDGVFGAGDIVHWSSLSDGTHVITATAEDRGGAVGSASITIDVGPQPPVLSMDEGPTIIVWPGDERTIGAAALDQVDGPIDANIQWTSALDGLVATGPGLSSLLLSTGVHPVRLAVTDSDGLTATLNIQVDVRRNGNRVPTVQITSPAAGSQFFPGDAVRLRGNASDPERGSLSGSIQWSSDLDGVLGSGTSLTVRTLRVGNHSIKALISDGDGAKAAAFRNITIRPRP